MVVNYSPKDFQELIIYHQGLVRSKLLPEELELFLISWKNRVPQKSFSLTIDRNDIITTFSLDNSDENSKIIKKYINLGVIKFKVEYNTIPRLIFDD